MTHFEIELEKLKNIIDDANKPNISGKKTCVV